MLLATVAAGYLSGVMAFQFLNALPGGEPQQVLASAVEAADTHFLITAAVMVVSLVVALSAARAMMVGLRIAHPLRALRGPVILSVVGAILTLILSLPGIFLVLLAGLAWSAYRIFDECFNPVPRLARPVDRSVATRGGGLADWS